LYHNKVLEAIETLHFRHLQLFEARLFVYYGYKKRHKKASDKLPDALCIVF